MLDDAAAFEQSVVDIVATDDDGVDAAFLHSREVGFEFGELSCAVEDVCLAVVVEE